MDTTMCCHFCFCPVVSGGFVYHIPSCPKFKGASATSMDARILKAEGSQATGSATETSLSSATSPVEGRPCTCPPPSFAHQEHDSGCPKAVEGRQPSQVPCPPPKEYWKCYHCGYVAIDDEQARQHFGPRNPDDAVHAAEIERRRQAVEGRQGDDRFAELLADMKRLEEIYTRDGIAHQQAREIENIFDRWHGRKGGLAVVRATNDG